MTQKVSSKPQIQPRRTAVAAAISAAIMASTITPATAQELEEVIVTATKRSESVQDVPLAITALSGDFVSAVNLDDVKDLISFTPGITGNSQDSFIDAVSIRGVRTQDFGVGGDPSAAIFKNEFYEGRNGSAVTSLYDVERAEVLRGPQGFLFGRNSIGGAISVYTKKAVIDSNEGYIELDAGERGHFVFEGAVNIPVSDTFAMRLSGYSSTEDGFVKNFATDSDLIAHDKQALRFSTTLENDQLTINTQFEFENREQSGSVYRAITSGDTWDTLEGVFGAAIVPQGDQRDADSDQSFGEGDDGEIITLGMNLEYDFEGMTLTSNTGFKDHEYFYTEDYDGTPLNINNFQLDQEGDYFQQELRLTSDTDGPLSWYAGVSVYKENLDAVFNSSGSEDAFCAYYGNYYYPGEGITDCNSYYAYFGYAFYPSSDGLLTEPGQIKGKFEGWAAYADFTYAVTDSFDFSVGVRHTDDKKEFAINVPEPESIIGPLFAYGFATDGAINSKNSWSDTQIRALGRFTFGEDNMVYASYTEGFKSGGFGSFSLVDANGDRIGCCTTGVDQASGAQSRSFQPETADSYEFGYKGTVLDGSSLLSVSAFFYDYEDLQISFFDAAFGANTVENIGQVDGTGLEGSLTSRLGDNWDMYLAASWLDTEATGIQSVCDGDTPDSCEGSSLFWAPEWTAAGVLTGRFPVSEGDVTTSLEVFYEGERGGGWGAYPETMISANTIVSARVGYDSGDSWSASLYVENLTDEFTYDGINNNGGILPSHAFGHRRPRTAGVRFNYSWE